MTASATAVYAVTEKGARLGARLAASLDATLYLPQGLAPDLAASRFTGLGALVAATFRRYQAHVFVAACGIAVRVIAPHLADKASDPAVVAVDDAGTFAVSLLSGHLGGANDLTREVAGRLGAVPVVTTATDAAGAPAVELLARDLGLALDNPVATRRVNAALAGGRPVAVFDPLGLFTVRDPAMARFFHWVAAPVAPDPDTPLVVVDWRRGPETPDRLYLRPRVLVLGLGCRRGASAEAIVALACQVLDTARASPASLGLAASIAAKADEPGLLAAAAHLGLATRFFTAGELSGVPVPHPSAVVAKHMGVGSVCEAAAILGSGGGRLLVAKTRSATATAALAVPA